MTESTLRGLQKVRVSKKFLLDKLKKNLKEHQRLHAEAMEGWKEKKLETLKSMLKKAKANDMFEPSWYLPKPESHEDDYERTITLVDASLDTEFELNSSEFDQYIMDEWSWKHSFTTTVSGYSPTVSG